MIKVEEGATAEKKFSAAAHHPSRVENRLIKRRRERCINETYYNTGKSRISISLRRTQEQNASTRGYVVSSISMKIFEAKKVFSLSFFFFTSLYGATYTRAASF